MFAEYSSLLDKMNNTPIGLLEEQAKIRDFKTQFVVVEEREASSSMDALSVVEVRDAEATSPSTVHVDCAHTRVCLIRVC